MLVGRCPAVCIRWEIQKVQIENTNTKTNAHHTMTEIRRYKKCQNCRNYFYYRLNHFSCLFGEIEPNSHIFWSVLKHHRFCWNSTYFERMIWVESGVTCSTYGSDSPGREFWPKCGPFLKKVEPSCDQTLWDIFDFSIDLGQLCPVDPRNTFVWPWKNFYSLV